MPRFPHSIIDRWNVIRHSPVLLVLILSICIALCAWADSLPATQPSLTPNPGETEIPVTFLAGHDTNPIDHGRPVILIASALGIPEQTFRDAFKAVHPAPPGRGPTADEARANKAALLKTLAPLGITNDRLDEVSNFYRYNRSAGETWKQTPAQAYARIKDGKILGFILTNPGAGYSSPPEINIAGFPDAHATATLSFTTDLTTNGSIKEITRHR
ncbi:MAG TPA: hypothetical protein VM008_19535 [Phycisphaerae bacterium]|nr:hypothetical protein [Phycisphaerae bacterium]